MKKISCVLKLKIADLLVSYLDVHWLVSGFRGWRCQVTPESVKLVEFLLLFTVQ
jgi:hypothetical protein